MEIELLDLDCLLHIFEYLPLREIIKLEETSPIFDEATQMFYRTIKRYECNIRDTPLEDLVLILTRIGPYLTSFRFSGGFVMPTKYKRTLIMTLTQNCTFLTTLSINYVPIEPEDVKLLSGVTHNLVELDLGNCHLGDADLAVILCQSKHLKRVKINGNTLLSGECLPKLTQMIEKLDVSYCYALKTEHLCEFLRQCGSKLRCLDVSGSYMIDWRDIFSVLIETQSQIEELYMVNLGVNGAQVPYESFKHLKVFDVQGRRLGT